MATTYRKHVASPWLEWIRDGSKTFEIRLLRKDWVNIKPGDILILSNEDEPDVQVKVVSTPHFETIAEAYNKLGKRMAPGFSNWSEVEAAYKTIFNSADQAKYSVVAVEIERI